VVVNGLILAEDGRKMSKSLKNYPEVSFIVNKYGADALRYYLTSSAVVRGEDLNFSEKGVDEIYKKIVLKLGNVVSFYELYEGSLKSKVYSYQSNHVLDKWIMLRLVELKNTVTKYLDKYELDRASRPILEFVDDLSVWYIRRSRERFKSTNTEEKNAVLYHTRLVLMELSKVIAPFMPFLAEDIYQKVKDAMDKESVHLTEWPKGGDIDSRLLKDMQKVRDTVTKVLEARFKAGIKVRQPLASLVIKENISFELRNILAEEVNIKEVVSDESMEGDFELDTTITPELKNEGNVRDFIRAIQEARKNANLTPSQTITISVQTDNDGKKFVEENIEAIKKPTNVGEIVFEKNSGEELKMENLLFRIKLQRDK
jgi:isoleucyl-tRNA synthetase